MNTIKHLKNRLFGIKLSFGGPEGNRKKWSLFTKKIKEDKPK